jgi:pyruvate dehydrogenase E2 component (dihydrolipoamide acetyltransferase)
MFVFELPEIGEGVVEGEVVRWLVQPGDTVATDQPLCEIMTDKATVEISSPKSGKVAKLHGRPGDVVKVHAPLVEIELGHGVAAPVTAPTAEAPPPPAPRAPPPVVAPLTNGTTAHPAVVAKTPPPPGARAAASPAVRQHARGAGVDINEVPGTGRGGRVTHADIDTFVAQPSVAQPIVAHAAAMVAPPAIVATGAEGNGDERIRIIGLRRKIAEKMVQAYRTAPHFTYVDEVDASRLVALRKSLGPAAEAAGTRLSYLPFIMKALVGVLRKFPTVNAVMDEAEFTLVVRREINIGIATDTDAGLYVPVVRNVESKSILELAAEVADLTRRTREARVRLDELQGGTFTITSVGNIGGRFATPILNHPEVAILGVNQIHDRPVAVDGQVVIRPMMYLSPSFDHRVIDGAVGARFVSALKAVLEEPERLLLELR